MLSYRDKKLLNPDTLPNFEPPYSCTHWFILRNENFAIIDTVYRKWNPNSANIFVDFFASESGGAFEKINFGCPLLNPFYGRFDRPFLNISGSPFSFTRISGRQGILTFRIINNTLSGFFKGKKVKLKVKIKDRALNESNEIETTEIQF